MDTTGYAVVGTGYFGAELARILATLPGARISAVHDPHTAAPVAAELGCDVEPDLAAMLERDDVDAVIVASPNHVHKEAVLAAAERGVHIFCEKPIALSYDDCDAMVAAAKDHGVVFMAGHIMNFFDGVRRLKQLINDGVLGDLLFAHSARNGWETPKAEVSWKKGRATSGGHLYHHIHELDCIQFLMGPAQRVSMSGGNVAHHGPGSGDEDDLLLLQLEFPGGRHGLCEYGSAFHWGEHYVLVQGTRGAARLDLMNSCLILRTPEGEQRFGLHRSAEEDADRSRLYRGQESEGAIRYGSPGDRPPLWLQGAMLEELTFFNDLMHGAQVGPEFTPLLTGQAARDSIATADAATRSLQERRWVDVAEVTNS
ncbi:MAG: Gfo/Idh/MocA family oxidoreductase [Propionibacteriaceae bacterium]|nr:Gfo/Idh/MocA family oxidoreductase [Propionibacteriaceae bacterium]